MSDQKQAIPEQKAGQPSEPSKAQGEGVQPEFLTRTEAETLFKNLENKFVSRTQGLLDSMSSSVQKRVQVDLQALQKVLEAQKVAGVEISPEQENALKQQTVMSVLTEEPEAPAEPEPQTIPPEQGQPGEQKGAPDPITQAAWSMMEERKVEILDEDPEAKTLDTSSPYKFLLSLDKAITAKETRLQQEPPPEDLNQTTGSPQNIPGVGAGGATGSLLPDGTPPIERLSSYFGKK